MTRRRGFTVGDEAPRPTAGNALSLAQNLAVRVPRGEERTFYVRDPDGDTVYRVERHAIGTVLTFTVKRPSEVAIADA